MAAKFNERDRVLFLNQESVILKVQPANPEALYYVATGEVGLPMWVRECDLQRGSPSGPPMVLFERRTPHYVIVDDF